MSARAQVVGRIMRGAAIAIAVVAVIDPALPRRGVRATVALVRAPGVAQGEELSARVRASLPRTQFVAGAMEGADATIVIGDPTPTMLQSLSTPALIVRRAAPVQFVAVRAPRTVLMGETAEIATSVRWRPTDRGAPRDGRRDSLVVELHDGAAVVARSAAGVSESRDTVVRLALPYVAARGGVIPLRLTARREGASGGATEPTPELATAGVSVVVDSTRRRVLVYEPRPAWISTFVRRALEGDPRFSVASRTVTSRRISAATSGAPATLADGRTLESFDVVVVGVPELITTAEGAALGDYLARGGSVVLLLDGPSAGGAGRVAGTGWSVRRSARPMRFERTGGATRDTIPALRGSVAIVPSALAGVEPLVATEGDAATPVVWRRAVGDGVLLVSGAADAWRHRGADQSEFMSFWRAAVSEMASYRADNRALVLESAVVSPGELVRGNTRWRAGRRPTDTLRLGGRVESIDESIAARGEARGALVTPGATLVDAAVEVAAPSRLGRYRLTVWSASALDSDSVSAEFLVAPDAVPFEAPDPDLVDAFTRASGGAVVSDSALSALPATLQRIAGDRIAPATWYPMRSPFWILPFALLLAGEWWIRRKGNQS